MECGGTQAQALYVHVPFCGSKCAYCSFASYVPVQRGDDVQTWLNALEEEVVLRLARRDNQGFATVFVGGGTPTFLAESELEALMGILGRYFSSVPTAEREVTIEANPDSLTGAKANILRRSGVTRVSLGVQSLDENLLRALGRRHRNTDVRRAAAVLREHGLTNINFDLMFGLPGQDMNTWECTVKEAVAMSPKHLSLYGLSVEPGTPLALKLKHVSASGFQGETGFIPLPDDDVQADMYEWAVDYLAEQGYERYETSNFAREGFTCRHNEAVWRGDDYIGLGPSAVSTQGRSRRTNAPELTAYVEDVKRAVAGAYRDNPENIKADPSEITLADRSGFSLMETLTKRQQMSEYMILGLRTARGVRFDGFYRRFGVALEDIFGQVLVRYSQDRVLQIEAGRVFLRPQYFFVANAVLRHFILEE